MPEGATSDADPAKTKESKARKSAELEATPATSAAKARRTRRKSMSAPEDNGGLVSAADTAGAGAAGVGGGTVVSVLASSLPDGFAKTVLIWLAPTATVAASALWIWARRRVVAHFDERYAKREFDAARTAIADALSNPSLTAEQRAEFEAKRVELDQMVVERRMAFATAHARGNRGSDRPGVRGG